MFSDLMLNLILHGSKRSTAHPVLLHEVEHSAPHKVGATDGVRVLRAHRSQLKTPLATPPRGGEARAGCGVA
jgi:hypothetical protein